MVIYRSAIKHVLRGNCIVMADRPQKKKKNWRTAYEVRAAFHA